MVPSGSMEGILAIFFYKRRRPWTQLFSGLSGVIRFLAKKKRKFMIFGLKRKIPPLTLDMSGHVIERVKVFSKI